MTMHGRRIAALATGAALAAGALVAAPIGAAPPAQAADALTITPNPAYAGEAFDGWGTSLVWFANATGDYPEELREELYQAVFGEDGLDLNIARYNIGGGNASDVRDYLRAGGAVEGWWAPDPDGEAGVHGGAATTYGERNDVLAAFDAGDPASYDWDADATQRWWVERLAADDRITHWETFANSAPYFMTESGYVSGGFNSSAEQLKPAAVGSFSEYLVRVTEHLEDQYGIDVESIDPLNEPNTNYWGTTLQNGVPVGGRQEGMHVGPARQAQLVDALRAELDGAATTTDAFVAAMDETNPGTFATNWAAYPAATRAAVDRMNVHTYGTSGRLVVRDLAKQADTDLWMSEIEGSWVNGYDPVNIENGLGIAGRIIDDLRELEPKAWVLWQPVEDLYNMQPQGENLNWGSIFIDLDCTPYQEAGGEVWKSARRVANAGGDSTKVEPCGVEVNSKFNTIRNFTKFIQEGDRLLAVDDLSSTAAIRADGTGATVVHRNTGAERQVTLDLSGFGEIADGATVTPYVTTQAPSADDPTANALVEGDAVAIDREAATATITVPAKSVTTFVVDGVSGVADDAPALRDSHRYQLVGSQSAKALTAGTSGAATTITTLAADSGLAARQTWTVHEVAPGERETTRRVVLEASDGRVLGATSAGTDLRAIGTDAAAASAATRWIVNTTDGRAFTLVNEALGLSLDVNGQSSAENATVGVYGSNGGANQSWAPRDLAPLAEQSVASRTLVGVAPVLPTTVAPRYAWGAGVAVPVEWALPEDSAWAERGRVDVNGTATDVFGQALAVIARVDVGGLTATDPVSVTVARGASLAGVQAAAPTAVPARVGASEQAFDVPVTWDWSDVAADALAEVGTIRVDGTATADGAELPARLSVLVTEGTLRNFAPDAGVTATASSTESGYPVDRTRNGVVGDKGWSNWVASNKPAQSTLTYQFAARQVEQVTVHFWRDGTNSWAQTMQVQLRGTDGAWAPAAGWEQFRPVASPTDGTAPIVTAEFPPSTATGVRVVMNAYPNTHLIVSEVQVFESVPAAASVSDLAVLRLDGETVGGFDPARTVYEVDVDGGRLPVLDAVAVDSAATVRVAQPTTANGGSGTVTVTSADGTSQTVYTIVVRRHAVVADLHVVDRPRVGTPAVATATLDPGDGDIVWQWFRNGDPIEGATGQSYTPVTSDAGKLLSVRVTVEADGVEPASAEADGGRIVAANSQKP